MNPLELEVNNVILEQEKMAEKDYMVQCLRKLKLYTKLVLETVRSPFISKFICGHL